LGQLAAWRPFPRFPMTLAVSPDGKVYAVALALAVVSGILFGLVPVRQVLRTDPYQVIKAGRWTTEGKRISLRDVLLAVQIALCALLVTSSMVAFRGLARSLHSNFGFEPRNALLVNTDLNMAGYSGSAVPPMQKRMIATMEAIPGVASVGLVDYAPLAMDGNTTNVYTDGTTDLRPANAAANTYVYGVSPDYFRAAGTVLLAGRGFSWHDDENAPRTAVVNREFARKVFGSIDKALGGHYKRGSGVRFQVVGVVEDGKYLNLTEEQMPAMFLPILQLPSNNTSLVVRSIRDPQQLTADIRNALRDLDSGLPSFIQTWDQALDGVLFPSRVATASLGVLGVLGAMLSINGIFGMAAYSVTRRLRELGIRMALGAQRKEVLNAALGRAFKLLAFGSTAGLLLGMLASRVLALIVYHATPRDPLVLAGMVLSMLLLGLVATWIPAQRALSLDPVTLLREE
jgi:predicted permease